MYTVVTHHMGQGHGIGVDTNEEANEEVNHFLSLHPPSMHTFCLVTNHQAGRTTKVWRSPTGERKHTVV